MSPGCRLDVLSSAVLWEGEEALSKAHGDPGLGCCDHLIQ